MKLFRPVGPKELALLRASEMRAFPPRLAHQPIFYPVMTFEYAEKIARDWNSTSSDENFEGYVVAFEITPPEGRWPIREAGGQEHRELWVPAEELVEFNSLTQGCVELIAEYKKGARV